MKTIKTLIASLVMLAGIGIAPLAATTSTFAAVNPQEQACVGTGGTWDGSQCNGTSNFKIGDVVVTIVNVLLYLIGIIAVIMIIIGAIRFVTSGGNSSSVTAAKNTILYAIIGLVIAVIAYAVVNFILKILLT